MKDRYYGAALQSPRNMPTSISVEEYWYNSLGIAMFWGTVIDPLNFISEKGALVPGSGLVRQQTELTGRTHPFRVR